MKADCTFKAGHYGVGGGTALQHTYVMATHDSGTEYVFPCFGDYSRHEGHRNAGHVDFPAMLVTPWFVGGTPVARELRGNLYFALGMAQWTLSPTYENWTEAAWERRLEADSFAGLVSWSGLAYSVMGVCHQAANRVLWATRTNGEPWDHSPCLFAEKSFRASYVLYQWWGHGAVYIKGAEAADKLRAAASAQQFASETGAEEPDLGADNDELQLEAIANLQHHMDTAYTAETRHATMGTLLTTIGGEVSPSAAAEHATIGADEQFHITKRDLDVQLLRGTIERNEYAAAVNDAYKTLANTMLESAPQAVCDALFPGDDQSELVTPSLMGQDYRAMGAQLNL